MGQTLMLSTGQKITVLDAVHLCSQAWRQVKSEMIRNCFRKSFSLVEEEGVFSFMSFIISHCLMAQREAILNRIWEHKWPEKIGLRTRKMKMRKKGRMKMKKLNLYYKDSY